MRTGPIELAATGTAPELFVINFRQRLEPINDLAFLDRLEGRVTAQATGERGQRCKKFKAAQHLHRLLEGVLRTQVTAVANDGMHEKTTVPGEESAIAAPRGLKQLSIFDLWIVIHIDTEET